MRECDAHLYIMQKYFCIELGFDDLSLKLSIDHYSDAAFLTYFAMSKIIQCTGRVRYYQDPISGELLLQVVPFLLGHM